MWNRNLTTEVLASVSDTPVVFIDGARQTGKSTLVQAVARGPHPSRYFTLDDATVRAAVVADPTGWLAAQSGPIVIDEVQRAPGLYLAIKAAVDRDRRPGRYLLTGSADALLLPRLADALVGRMARLTLWPFSMGECARLAQPLAAAAHPVDFVAQLFAGQPTFSSTIGADRSATVQAVCAGGYPEALQRAAGRRREAWFDNYVTTILQRDIPDMTRIADADQLRRLLALVAVRTAQLHNGAEMARTLGMPHTTLDRHLALLHAVYLVQSLPAWTSNLGKRLVKSPKLMLTDTGLAAHLCGLNADRLQKQPQLFGPLLETYVAMDLRKQLGWSAVHAQLFHFRDHGGTEVDLLLEDRSGGVAAIEVKAAGQVGTQEFKGLRVLRDLLGERFRSGVVIYLGDQAVPFGDRLWAVPLQAIGAN